MLTAFPEAAKEEMFSPWCADPALAADLFPDETRIAARMSQGKKPHQGVASKKSAPHQGIAWSKSTTALGLPGVWLEKGNGSRCTGKERDAESGLDYFGARYYANTMGRWITPDKPFADQHLGNPQSWNLYMYAGNRPTSLVDPNGEEVKEVTKTVTYTVHGATAGEAWNNAPAASGIAGGYRGNTDTNIGVGPYSFSYTSQSGQSSATVTDTVTNAEVDLTVTITLPSWDGYNSASPQEQQTWDNLSSSLQDHENGHKDIAEQGANALDKSLPGTSAKGTGKNVADAHKDADTKLGAKIEDKHQQAVKDTQAKQDAYDKQTDHGAHQENRKKDNQQQ